MFDYLQQFNNLPKDLRDKVSSPQVMATLSELEKKYQVDLAMTVMKVMIKNIAVKNLPVYFISDFNLDRVLAENLAKELTSKVLLNAATYLGLEKEVKALDLDTDINLIIADAGLVLPSNDLVNRFKVILSTYLKGIRSKVAARDALAKPVNMGGLTLTAVEIDRVFKICEQKTFTSLEVNQTALNKFNKLSPQSRLDKIIASADGISEEYNLKKAIASGQVKIPEMVAAKFNSLPKLDTSHELPVPEKELDLPLMETPVVKSPASELPKIKLPIHSDKPAVSPISIPMPIPPMPPKAVASSASVPVKQFIAPATAPIISAQPVLTPEVKPIVNVHISRPSTAPSTPRPIQAVQKPIAAARSTFAPSISKKEMHDIKPMPKVMGPLEELQFLDLLNYRRLGKTPTEINAKVFSKIKLLEADGYDKMVAGVRAWRQSPVNRLYLKMVQEAMNKGMTIKDFALTKQVDNKNYLSLEEIEAILAMNSKLVF